MAHHPIQQIVDRALLRHAMAEASDGELLRRFMANRDGSAFAELVERYAALVSGVCRRVLGPAHPALDDAFQTTFVTLALKAASLRSHDRLPAWLYGVARRVAWRLRTARQRIITGDVPELPSPAPSPSDRASEKEWLAAVEAEVQRLPEKYRSAVLLCWFDDGSLDQAARQLGVSKGTLWGWVKRARELLRRRLAARGFGLPAVLAASLVATSPVSAHLIAQTVEASLQSPVEQGAAAVLTGGTSMAIVRYAGGLGLAATILIGAVTLLPARVPEPERDSPKDDPDPKPKLVQGVGADGVPLPPGAIHRFGSRQFRHPDGIHGSAMSPDGKYLATLGQRTVIVWDLQTQAARQIIRDARIANHGMDVGGVQLAFLPDGRSLAVTADPNHTTGLRPMLEKPIRDLAIVFDVETGKEKFILKGQPDYLVAVWVTAGGKELATFAGGSVRFYDAKDGKELKNVALKDAAYARPWVAPGADRIAIQSVVAGPIGIALFDARSGKELYSLPNSKVIQAALTADGKLLAVHDATGKVRIHDIDAQKELFAFDHPADKQMGPMRFSKDAQTLYFGGQHGQLYRWDLKNNKRLPDPGRHSTWTLSSIALSPDESILYSMGWNKLIHRFDLKTGKQLPTPDGYITQTVIAPHPDGKRLIVADHGGNLDYWDLATGQKTKRLQTNAAGFDCMDVTPDGRWLAGGRTFQDVQIWDLAAGKVDRLIPLAGKADPRGGDHVKRVAFRSDGKVLVTGSQKTGITAWDRETGKKLWNAAGIGHLFAWDPKGRWIVAGGGFSNQNVRWTMLKPDTGEVIRQIDVATEPASKDGTIFYTPYLMDIAFAPDGSRVVTAHSGGTVRLWDPVDGKELARLNGTGTGALAFSPDGKWLAVNAENYQIQIWELMTGKRLRTITGHDSLVREAAFTRDGKGLVGNADLAPTLWSLMPRDLPADAGPAEALWETLAKNDGEKTFYAQWALVRDSKAAVSVFKERVKPAEQAMERAQFDKLVADLDSAQFRTREFAEKELAKAGHKIPVSWLRQALEGAKSTEQATRLNKLRALREKPTPAEWQLARAVQVLELAGTKEAKELLRQWAEASQGSLLAVDASAALERLKAHDKR